MSNGRGRKAASNPVRDGVGTGLIAFVLAMAVSWPLKGAMNAFPAAFAVPITLLVVGAGVAFDTIGVAAASADEAAFHAMAAKKMPGARQSILIVRNAGKVITVCNDIVGDLAGTLSGAAAAAAAIELAASRSWNPAFSGAVAVAVVAALTIGGKAAAKSLAIGRAGEITRWTGYTLYLWEKWTGIKVFGGRK